MPERQGDHLEIKGRGLLGRGLTIKLNGEELRSCRRIELVLDATEINIVQLTLSVEDFDIDADALAELVAFVDMRSKRRKEADDGD